VISKTSDFNKDLIKTANDVNVPLTDYKVMFTAIFVLIQSLKRHKNLNNNDLQQLFVEIKFNPECVQEIINVVLPKNQITIQPLLLKPANNRKYDFRINLLLKQINLTPTVIFYVESMNEINVITMSQKQFHKFRFIIAKILSEFCALETKR
jgi:hypothetical protein